MIRLNLQTFAKSASRQVEYRKKKQISKYEQEAKIKTEENKSNEPNMSTKKKSGKGEAVTAVNMHDEYQVFVYENGKERPYTDKEGNNVYRTGSQVSEKMIYNKSREAWESKAQLKTKQKDSLTKIRKYIIRKRIK